MFSSFNSVAAVFGLKRQHPNEAKHLRRMGDITFITTKLLALLEVLWKPQIFAIFYPVTISTVFFNTSFACFLTLKLAYLVCILSPPAFVLICPIEPLERLGMELA